MENKFWDQFDSVDNKLGSKSIEHEHLNNVKNKSLLEKSSDFVSPFNNFIKGTRLPEASAGLLQNTINTGASILNAPLEAINSISGTNYKVPYADFSKNIQKDPLSQAVFKGSELASGLGTGIGAYKTAGKALRMGAESPIYQRILQGGSTGYLTGGSNDDQESAYNLPNTRYLNAGIGASLAGAGQLSNNSLIEKIIANKKNAENKSSMDYMNFINKAENYQPKGYNIKNYIKTENPYDKKLLTDLFSKDQRRVLEDFYKNPTLNNAHFSQSEIASKIRNIEKDIEKGSITETSGNKKIEKLKDLRSDITLGMGKFLAAKNPDFVNEYNKLGQEYLKNVVPYKKEDISKYISGEMYANKTLKNLMKDRKFMESAGKDIGGMGTRKAINSVVHNPFIKYGILPYLGIHEINDITGGGK